jgi:transketolase
VATRRALNACIDATAAKLPGLLAGSADLTGNNGVKVKGARVQEADSPDGIQVHYGVREFGMGAVMNGLAQHGGVLPVGGTFFVFSDYMRPSVRLAALTGSHVIYSWTHDSVGLGEDGPTHQPVEHLASLRAMPGLTLIRPADANETAQAWRLAVDMQGPVGLALSRQNMPVLEGTAERGPEGVARGAYVLRDAEGGDPQIVLVGTGSEVQHCLAASSTLSDEGILARVVSFPCWESFERQDDEYRAAVFPPGVPVLSIEAGATLGWDRYADDAIGIDHFGASAPGGVVMAKFGFTPEHVVERAHALLARRGG